MSNFQDAISWLQNGEIQLLFFIVGYREDVKPIPNFEFTGANSSQFYDYRSESIFPVVLVEVRAGIESQNADKIVREMFLRFEGRSEFLICMFDGSYLSSEDLTDSDNVEHIFAVKTPETELLGFNDELRQSDDWRRKIMRVQAEINSRFGSYKPSEFDADSV